MEQAQAEIKLSAKERRKRKPTLPIRTGYRVNRFGIKDGSVSLLRAYSAGALDRRRTDGRIITQRENQYARHLGFDGYQALPVTLAGKVHLVIRLELFLSLHEPSPDSKTGFRDIRSAENSLNRIYTELGLKPALKPVPSLADYLAAKEREQKVNLNHERKEES